jgi:hypothetical protein
VAVATSLPLAAMSAKSPVALTSHVTVTSSAGMPPPFSGSGARRVHSTTPDASGSPDATPSVNGSPDSSTVASVVVGAAVVLVTVPPERWWWARWLAGRRGDTGLRDVREDCLEVRGPAANVDRVVDARGVVRLELLQRPAGLRGGVRDSGVEVVGGDAAAARRLHQHATGADELDGLGGEQCVLP